MYEIVGHQWGECGFCAKTDRDTLRLVSKQHTLDAFLCLRCLVQFVKLHMPKGDAAAGGGSDAS